MRETNTQRVRDKLDQLRTELTELAFALEQRRQLDAADVALSTSVRVGEICEELLVAER